MGLAQDRKPGLRCLFIPDREESSVFKLNGAWVAEIAGNTIAGNGHGLRPCFTVVFADACLVSEWFAAMTVAHQETSITKPGEEGGESPHSDGMGSGPGFPSILGFALEGFSDVGFVVISDVDDEAAIAGLDGMEFVIIFVVVTFAGWNGCEPLPGLAIIARLTDAGFLSLVPEFLPGIQESSVGELRGSVGAIDDGGIARGPGDAPVG